MARIAAPIVATVLLLSAACTKKGTTEPPETSAPTTTQSPSGGAAPKEPAPTVPRVQSAPPPAWIETSAGSRWLAFFSYCWGGTCIDSRPVEQRTDVPTIEVVSNTEVRFHLDFAPSELALKLDSTEIALPKQKVASWRVTQGGLATLIARTESNFRAEYVARLVVK
jgi:hypothetical protein